ncbi:MAG TPA: PspC domain-containing protein [Nocardioidaceae bacterium]|nr:PspC domain-containing protein [Nocardioidaceae bacterium]
MSDTSSADPDGFDPGRLRTAPMQMRRSRDDRYIAGVCGGLARYLNIDPVIVRVIMAALVVVGGVGIVIYLAAWLLAPEDGVGESIVESHLPRNDKTRMLGWIVAAVLAVGALVGSGPWFGWGWIGPLPLLGIAVLVWVLARPRQGPTATTAPPATPPVPPPPPTAAPSTPSALGDTEDIEDTDTDTTLRTSTADSDTTETDTIADADPRPAADSTASTTTTTRLPPTPPPPAAPTAPPTPPRPPATPRPRNDHGALTLLTLAALLAVMGVMSIVDQTGTDIDGPVYLAGALGVVAAGMLVGTWWGNGRWLIPFGAILTTTLIAVSQLPVWKTGEIKEAPTRSDDVLSSYEMGVGRIELDLTQVEDPAALDGRTITMDNGVGEIDVVLPDTLDVTVSAELNLGHVEILGREANGGDASTQYTDADDADPNVRIEIDGSIGNVEVTRA